jgi:multidrug efflux system membrane fusion protein
MVPVSALRQGNNGEFVFVLNQDRTVTQRPVKRGLASADRIQIASGLQVGERVITVGADRLRDGAPVVLPGDAPGGGGGAGGRRRGAASGPAGAASGAAPAAVGSDASASSPRQAGSGGERRRRRDAQAPAAAAQ